MSADARAFYEERVPAQFNRTLEARLAAADEDDRVVRGLVAVDATLAVLVEADAKGGDAGGGGSFFLNIRAGRMSAEAEGTHDPFLTLVHDGSALAVLERESGDSILSFLGGMAGLAGEVLLTEQRIQALRMIGGAIRFTLRDDDGFSLLAHFGTGPVPDEPGCSLGVEGEIYRKLRAGEVDAQEAFMSGQIDILGDMQMAMQLALAVLSPD